MEIPDKPSKKKGSRCFPFLKNTPESPSQKYWAEEKEKDETMSSDDIDDIVDGEVMDTDPMTYNEMEAFFRLETERWLSKNAERLFIEKCKNVFETRKKVVPTKSNIPKTSKKIDLTKD